MAVSCSFVNSVAFSVNDVMRAPMRKLCGFYSRYFGMDKKNAKPKSVCSLIGHLHCVLWCLH